MPLDKYQIKHRQVNIVVQCLYVSNIFFVCRNYTNIGSSIRLPYNTLPAGTAAPQIVLAAEPVSTHDIQLVSSSLFILHTWLHTTV